MPLARTRSSSWANLRKGVDDERLNRYKEILGQVRDLGVAVLSKPFRLTEVMAVLGTIVEDSIADPTRPVPVAAAY